MISRRAVLKLGSASALAAAWSSAHAAYPDKPIRLVVPLAPGGNGDIMARLAVPTMVSMLGQPVVVDNKGGGGGSLGGEAVARAKPDGYTLLWGANGPLVNSPLMLREPHYDAARDFAAVGLMSLVPMALVVKPSLPVHSLEEFVSYSATRGKQGVSIGTSGIGGANHIPLEVFKAATHANILHVPYRGGGAAIPDLLGGNVDGLFTEVSTVLAMHADGRARILGVTSDRRSPLLPDVQTFIEYGLKDFTAYTFNGLWAPARTPPSLIAPLQRALAAAVRDPRVVAGMQERAAFAASAEQQTSAGAQAFLENEIARARRAMQIADIKPE
jgi:tripartite-type tricarboxylate transporter receptor subunit TctC